MMIRPAMIKAVLSTLVILAMALPVGAEICMGCKGTGRIGCGRCFWPFIGKCSHCTGVYSTTSPSKCPVCRGSQICPGCNGNGAQCMVCRGSGRLPDGTGAAIEARRQEELKTGMRQALQPFKFLAGEPWTTRGADSAGSFTGRIKVNSLLDGTFCLLSEQTRYNDGRMDESECYLTFEPSNGTYFLLILTSSGRIAVMRGKRSSDGATIQFGFTGQDDLRLTWHLLPGAGFDSRFERQEGGAWNRLAWSEVRRDGPAPAMALSPSGQARGLMQHLAFLAGNWNSQGGGSGGAFTGQIVSELILGGSFLRMREKSQYADGRRLEGEILICGEADSGKFRMIILTSPGQSTDLRGTPSNGGRTIDFRVIDQEDQKRLLWRLQPSAGLDSAFETPSESGWQTAITSKLRRAGP